MRFKPTKSGGRVAEGKTPFGNFRVEWDSDGKLISESIEIRTPRPPMPIPDDYDPAELKRPGCCDPPTESP